MRSIAIFNSRECLVWYPRLWALGGVIFYLYFAISVIFSTVVFQNCSEFGPDSSPSSDIPFVGGDGSLNQQIETFTLDNIKASNRIDLLSYMISSNIQGNIANTAFYKQESYQNGKHILSVTKFNDPRNIEIFTADSEYIYIRYESSPETYGGTKNSMRRFEGVSPSSVNTYSVAQATGTRTMGAIWSKRYVSYVDANTPLLVAHSIDQYIYGNNSSAPIPGDNSNAFVPMYIWMDFKPITTRIPFVAEKNQPDHKLVISQQWSRCNTEQYEYAIGVGYVGWRSLVSLDPACSNLVNTSQRQSPSTSLVNYMSNLNRESFVVVQGMPLSSPIDVSQYPTRAMPSFYPANSFLDDYPYLYSTPTSLLDVLRTSSSGLSGNGSNNSGTNESLVRSLYLKHLLREPDDAGLNFYKSLLDNGTEFSVVANDIRQSTECKVDCL